ncbi:MAG TPA: glutamate--tRNA ligase, partial [Bacilli bacterium]|nr:glutamate--tRNA ligase [Bacilli bacterium]
GWCPPNNKEILPMDELIKEFDYHKISKAPSQYDKKKLAWINAHYIKSLSDEDYINFIKPFLLNNYNTSNKSEEWIRKLLLIYKDHVSYGKEISSLVDLFFKEEIAVNNEALEFMNSDDCIPGVLTEFKKEIDKISDWNVENINIAINNTKENSGIKGKMLYMPIRIKTTGIMHGPELPDTLYLLGKETIINRLNS